MPNWCSNTLTLTHEDAGQLIRARNAFVQGNLMQEFLPCPQELLNEVAPNTTNPRDMAAKYGATDWYSWCVNNWGTKWDVGDKDISTDDLPIEAGSITFSFDSAWSPPIAFYNHLQDLGFHVDAFYYEPGMSFCGRYLDGDDDCYEISGNAEWVQENIPEDIDQMFGIAESMMEWEPEED